MDDSSGGGVSAEMEEDELDYNSEDESEGRFGQAKLNLSESEAMKSANCPSLGSSSVTDSALERANAEVGRWLVLVID